MRDEIKIEICNECGRSVKISSGLFVNRVVDFNEYEDRLKMNKPYPKGNYICPECDENINKNIRN
jgi:uncharacterized protein YlaI